MKALLEYCYELMELELRAQHTDQLFTLLHMAERIDLQRRGGIIEKREYNDPDFIQDPDTGQMQGSRPSGGDDGGENTAQSGDEDTSYYSGFKEKLSTLKDSLKEKLTPEKYKEASDEYLSSLPKLKEPETMEQSLAGTNPGGFINNCQRCVPVYEMRRRGYDVTAADAPDNPLEDNIGLGDYKKVFVGAKWTTCQGTGQEEITDYLQKSGDGTTVEISINIGNSGHLFVGHRHNGQVIFVDPQTGKANAKDRFSRAVEGYTEYARIDDLKPSDLIKDCVEE